MSIAVPSYAPGSIASYSALLAEVRDMMDDENYPQDAIDRALRKCEALFNRELRTSDMETRLILPVSEELTPLPENFLGLRFIFQEGQPDRDLKSMSPHALLSTYGGRSGCPQAYSIEGRNIRVGPVGSTTLELTYYAKIPALTDAQTTNWLLTRHPDLYISGVLYYLALRERDSEGAAAELTQVTTLLASIKGAQQRNRWGAAPLVPAGFNQVRGARM